ANLRGTHLHRSPSAPFLQIDVKSCGRFFSSLLSFRHFCGDSPGNPHRILREIRDKRPRILREVFPARGHEYGQRDPWLSRSRSILYPPGLRPNDLRAAWSEAKECRPRPTTSSLVPSVRMRLRFG